MTEKRKRARFPGLNSTRWIPFVDRPPERGEDESEVAFKRRQDLAAALEGVEIEVRMLDRETLLEFENRLMRIAAAEDARRAKEPDAPGLSVDFYRQSREVHEDVVFVYVAGVRGIDVGEVNLDQVKDPALLATLLSTAGLLADASMLARRAQNPTPQQLER